MTDNEIIKALECCVGVAVGERLCISCPLFMQRTCFRVKDTLALDLINHQKAELDDLKRDDLPRCKDALRRANEIGMGLEKENQKLRAEIERLGCDLAVARGLLRRVDSSLVATRNNARAEAIKEFAERLKDYYIKDKRYDRPNAHTMICFLFDRIDNLAKEMGCAYTGEQVLQSYCHQKCEDYSPLPKKRKDGNQ